MDQESYSVFLEFLGSYTIVHWIKRNTNLYSACKLLLRVVVSSEIRHQNATTTKTYSSWVLNSFIRLRSTNHWVTLQNQHPTIAFAPQTEHENRIMKLLSAASQLQNAHTTTTYAATHVRVHLHMGVSVWVQRMWIVFHFVISSISTVITSDAWEMGCSGVVRNSEPASV